MKQITQLLPKLILIKAAQAQSLALHTTLQLLASEMAHQQPGSEVVANRLAEVLFIQAIRAHVASVGDGRNHGWFRAIFDPQIGAALKAVYENVNHPWTVESLAETAGMSRSAFATRLAPLEYVTEWRMQKAVQLLRQRDKKLSKSQRVSAMNQTPLLVRHSNGFSASRRANTAVAARKPLSHRRNPLGWKTRSS